MELSTAKQIIESGFEPVPPGHPMVKDLMTTQARYIALDNLDRKRSLCKWCWVKETPSYRHFYCNLECKLSAEIFCYPQREFSKLYHMHLQKGCCANCERDFFKLHNGQELKPELDHCVPIFKGGQALGHENHQLLCVQCHKIKSVEERKGW